MSGLNSIKLKEKFLSSIEGVEVSEIFDAIQGINESVDAYTYFVTKNALNTGEIDSLDFMDYMLKLYSDWYFLHKDGEHKSIPEIKLFSKVQFSPTQLSSRECLDIIRDPEFRMVLPVTLQYINKLEDKFFVSIDSARLYGRQTKASKYLCRLYLNLPANKIVGFVREFLDRVYIEDFSCIVKFLNDDSRSDTIVIYTDYESVQKIVDTIEDIRDDYPNKFDGVGKVSELLGLVNEYIGFGENPEDGSTYFKSRTQAIDNLRKIASRQVLKDNLVKAESKIIYRQDGTKYTPTEYLMFLIRRNAIKIIESKILSIEEGEYSLNITDRLKQLYSYREDVDSMIQGQVERLKKSITRDSHYTLSLESVGDSDYDYIDKLYNVFVDEESRPYKISEKDKKRVVASHMLHLSDEIGGIDVRKCVSEYFRAELTMLIEDMLDKEMTELKSSRQSSILNNLKKKEYLRLKQILKNIINDDDEGKLYINDCINDYLRILSGLSNEQVEIFVNGKKIIIDSGTHNSMINLFPSLEEQVNNLICNNEFIDKTLRSFDINPNNICLNLHTKCKCRKREKHKTNESTYYYNPEGFLESWLIKTKKIDIISLSFFKFLITYFLSLSFELNNLLVSTLLGLVGE